jgi:hypothetical protein
MTNHKHTLTTFDGLARSVAQLRAENAATKVDKAILAKLLAPEQRSWAIKYVAENPDGWEKFVGGVIKDRQDRVEQQEREVCARMGVDRETFVAAKAARAAKV